MKMSWICLLAVVVFLIAAETGPMAQSIPKVGTTVVLKLPRAVLGAPNDRLGEFYDVEIKNSPAGIEIAGRTDWERTGLPSLLELKVTKITKSKDSTIVSVTSSGPTVLLRFVGFPDPAQAFDAITLVGDGGAVADYKGKLHAALSPTFFRGGIEVIPPATRDAILSMAQDMNATAIAPRTFQGATYLQVDLGRSTVLFNSLVTTSQVRASRSVNDRLLSLLREVNRFTSELESVAGVSLLIRLPVKDFSRPYGEPALEELELVVPRAELAKFALAEITGQQLIDASAVIVAGNRTKLDLSITR